MSKPIVFFGSSVEDLPLVDELRAGLAHIAYHRSWDMSIPPGSQTLSALRQAALESDFAVFVFGPDDWTESRTVRQQSPRDNVVFEAGLFAGLLGFDRVVIVHEHHVKRPSDLDGFACLSYVRTDQPKDQAANAVPDIRKLIASKGERRSSMSGVWWQYHIDNREGRERAYLSILRVEASPVAPPKIIGLAWTAEGKLVARFESRAASMLVEATGVFYYWEGDWPTENDRPEFHGRGKITLKMPDRASGWYTTESDNGQVAVERHEVEYLRGTEEDWTTVTSNAIGPEGRSSLIKERLEAKPDFLP